ncbi:MAG: cell envelope biogenesis protein OmpA [Bacteroidetes bacterium]|nr:MAG: cell envelope biogenesis protein OmpA [Bacteroidota bacterium]
MKMAKRLFVLFFLLGVSFQNADAQFVDKLIKHAKEKVKEEAEIRSERRIDRGIDKAFDDVEDVIDGKKKPRRKRRKKVDREESVGEATDRNESRDVEAEEASGNCDSSREEKGPEDKIVSDKQDLKKEPYTPKLVWSKFDFVPGDEVIFEDGPDPMEENGEFPSRWDLVEGNAEIVEVDGEKAIYLKEGDQSAIIPYMKNRKEDYLPEVFTIEFDYYIPKDCDSYSRYMNVYLHDLKNQETVDYSVYLQQNCIESIESVADGMSASGKYPGTEDCMEEQGMWRHLSIAYTRGKLKIYLDDVRVINIPHFELNPTGFTLQRSSGDSEESQFFIKNVRIAEGGVKYYDRVMQEGKIVANGIRFDVGDVTLKPESMGPINSIYKLMKKKPDIRFSVEGHTDAEGDEADNQVLSEGRAKVVVERLVEMGISQDRLTSKGWGERMPIAGNDTPEGRANNRRVEFVVVE